MLMTLWCSIGMIIQLNAQDFVHPGILHKESDLARARQKIAEQAEPWYTAWKNLLAAPEAQLSWTSHATDIVYRGSGTPNNIQLMYRDVAAVYEHAMIYKINGDLAHAAKAAEILNAWANINTSVSGNSDRFLALGLNGYQFAMAAELMRGYSGFNVEKFKKYLMTVFYPNNSIFLINHNDACATNYRVNWDICNMNSIMAIGIFCDNKDLFNEALSYAKNGDGTGNITRSVNFLYPNLPTVGANIWGQWEESGRDQGHAVGGLQLYGLFCEMSWNQGIDMYGYDNCRYRKGAEYVARYNIMMTDSTGAWVGKYNDLPYTTYSRQMGSNCSWYTESALGAATRGKYGRCWETIYNHYAHRLNQGDKIKSITEILQQQPSTAISSTAVHADTYDTPGIMALTSAADSGTYILPWEFLDISARSIAKLPVYGKTTMQNSVLTVYGTGAGIKGASDYCQFAYQKIVDDGSIIARINSIDEVNSLCQAGLMIRENLEQNSVNALLSLTASQGAVFTVRDSTGKTTKTVASNTAFNTFPYWLQLSRSGNTFTASVSPDSLSWTTIGSAILKFNRLTLAGLAVSSNNTNALCKAVFDKAKFIQGNIRPIVKMVSPAIGHTAYVAPANIYINGSAYDLDGALDKVEVYVNDSLYFTSKVSPFTYNLLSVNKTGTYKLLAKAYDKAGAVQVSDTVTYVINATTTKLPYYKFDEKTTGYFAIDSNGNNLTGILYNGPIPATGEFNNAISMDGVDDYVKLPNGFIEKLSDFTIATWVKYNAQTSWSRILDLGSGTTSYMFLSPYNGSGLMSFSMLSSDGRTQTVNASSALPIGAWHHVAVTLGANKLTIYLDGAAVGTSYPFYLRPYDLAATTANYLGKSQFSSDPYFNGLLDDMRFYNYGMTLTEIKNLYLKTSIVKEIAMKQVSIYPNPAKEKIVVGGIEEGRIYIYNSVGSLVWEQEINSSNQAVNINNLATGTYIVAISDITGNITRKVLMVK